MNQYDVAFLRFTVFFTFFLCLPIAVLFFVLSLFYNVVDYDIWLGPVILVSFPLMAFLYCLLRILNEKRLVKLQMDRYGIRITDEPARQIERKSSVYLGDSLLIYAGRYTFDRSFIKQIKIVPQTKFNSTGGYYCKLTCVNGKTYRVFLPSTSECKKIKDWFHC